MNKWMELLKNALSKSWLYRSVGMNKKEIENSLEKHMKKITSYLEQTSSVEYGGTDVRLATLAQALASYALYLSGKRLELLSKILIGLTVVLAILTIALLLRG